MRVIPPSLMGHAAGEADAVKARAAADADAMALKLGGEAKGKLALLEAEAKGKLALLEAEAQGRQKLLDAQAEGLAKFTEGGRDAAAAIHLILAQQVVEVARVQASAIERLKFDKVVLMGGGKDGASVGSFVQELYKNVLPLHEVAKAAGVKLPEFLGTEPSDEVALQTPRGKGANNGAPSGKPQA